MKEKQHYLVCASSICAEDPNPNFKDEILWYPGERVCRKFPYQEFQKKQLSINMLVKKGKFKDIDKPYTANELENSSI